MKTDQNNEFIDKCTEEQAKSLLKKQVEFMANPTFIKSKEWKMSQREHFAGLAMQGFVSRLDSAEYEQWQSDIICKNAIVCADALIAELNKEEK